MNVAITDGADVNNPSKVSKIRNRMRLDLKWVMKLSEVGVTELQMRPGGLQRCVNSLA